jgi:hypothetical protein
MTIDVEVLETVQPIRCSHARCDGRPAHWTFPQTFTNEDGPLYSCSVHLARLCEVVLKKYAAAVPAPNLRNVPARENTHAA